MNKNALDTWASSVRHIRHYIRCTHNIQCSYNLSFFTLNSVSLWTYSDDDYYDDDDIHYCDDVLKHFLYCLEILYSHILLSAFELHPSQRKSQEKLMHLQKKKNYTTKLPSASTFCIDMRIKRKCIFFIKVKCLILRWITNDYMYFIYTNILLYSAGIRTIWMYAAGAYLHFPNPHTCFQSLCTLPPTFLHHPIIIYICIPV